MFRGIDDDQNNTIEVLGLHIFLSLFVKNGIFCSVDLEMDFSTLKMTLSHKNNPRNGLPSQNDMKMWYYTCSWLNLLKNHI